MTWDPAALVELIYAAALGEASWTSAVKAIADALGAESALFFTPTIPDGTGVFVPHAIDPSAIDKYIAYYHDHDLWFRAMQRQGVVESGQAQIGDQLIARRDFERSEWYNDFLRRIDIYHLLSNMISGETDPILPCVGLSLFRPRRVSEFDSAAKAKLASLRPHLRRALTIQFRMQGAQSAGRTLAEVLDRLSAAVVLLTRNGRVALTNEAARKLLGTRDGLRIERSRLVSALRTDGARLEAAVLATVAEGAAHHAASQSLSVARPSGRRAYQLIVAPLARGALDAANSPAAAVFIIDPEQAPELPASRVARLLGLTAAEARLAAALASGASLKNYAEANGISIGTARWTLKQALAKTDTEKQSALIALVLRTAIIREP